MDFHPITHMNAFKVQELAKNLVEVDSMVGNPWDLMMNLQKFKVAPARHPEDHHRHRPRGRES